MSDTLALTEIITMRILLQTAITLVVILVIACQNPPEFPLEPIIEYKSMSKTTLLQGNFMQDSTLLVLSFTDGDGDLGNEDSVSIFLIDNRDNFNLPGFKIPFIGEQGVGKGISGEISIALPTTCCTYPGNLPPCQVFEEFPTDTLTYDLYIIDRAGNESNRVTTEPIILRCN